MRNIDVAQFQESVTRIATFGAVGVAATCTHWLVSLGLAEGVGAPAQLANVSGFAVAVLVSFFGHHHLTFRSKESARRTFPRFVVVALSGLAASAALIAGLDGLGAPTWLQLTAAPAIIPVATYVANRFWVF